MRIIVILVAFIMTALSVSGQCFNIHKMIEASGLYRSKLDFSKEVVLKKGDIHVFKDFVLINDADMGILKKIEKGQTLSKLKELIELDTLELMYSRQKGVPIKELIELKDSIRLPSTFFFYTFYNLDYIIFAEINFRDWNDGDLLEAYEDFEAYGFEISALPARVNIYTFKCGELGELIHIRTDDYGTYCW